MDLSIELEIQYLGRFIQTETEEVKCSLETWKI